MHSNHPNATVTARSGYSRSWHTNGEGYADVYLRGPTPGQTIDVTASRLRPDVLAGHHGDRRCALGRAQISGGEHNARVRRRVR
jgi:hypothetical protein